MPRTSLKRGQTGTAAANRTFQPVNDDAYTVATVPPAASNLGRTIYVSNGAAGSPCGAISYGTNWLRFTLGAAISAT